jgi:hypothetical protein
LLSVAQVGGGGLVVVEEVVVFTGLPPSMKGIVAVRSNVLERNFIVFFVFVLLDGF